MTQLYQATLLAHAKNPHGAGVVPRGTEDAEAFNSACGDEIRVKLAWTPEGGLARLTYELHGCAVSAASASLAAQRLEGKTPTEIATMAAAFDARIGRAGFEDDWGDFRAFNGIERYPARIHCAQLVWRAVRQALEKKRTEK
ncbi:MAG TPA: SUF system NifU family Fe-S cluster assembly protein [Kiritimatiellia bacterium]|nr:SUF system NifU family Fe-S cluster assembly protein [Kiritimatiellia bacterium]